MIPETERIERLSAEVTGAQSCARDVAARLARLGDPDAAEAVRMLEELTTLTIWLHDDSHPPESPVIVSRLMCISARCYGPLGDLRILVDHATAFAT